MAREALDPWVRAVRESPAAGAGAIAFAVFLFWAARDGGFDPLRWLPAALFLLALLMVTLFVARPERPSRPVLVALVALGAFTVWSYLSMLWADLPGDAWLGANKTFLYLCVFALFVAYRWHARVAATLLGAYAVGVAALGLITIARLVTDENPASWFIGGRIISPISYSNANCALFLSAFFPAVYIASRREVHPVVRGTLLASAGVCAELALLVQSRASMGAFPVALAVYLLIVPGRLRSLTALLPVGVAALVTARPMLDIYRSALTGDRVDIAGSQALSALVGSAVSLFVAGALLGLVDGRVLMPARVVRAAGVVAVAVAALAFVAVSTVAIAEVGSPISQVDEWLEEFRVDRQEIVDPNIPHLSSGFGGGRYDLWRIGWSLFVENPVLGIGVDNFYVDFVRERRGLNDSSFPHSLELRVLSQTGIVGGALFATFLVSAFVAVGATVRRPPPFTRGLAAAACAGFVYWLVHGSVDWFWEMPGLAAPAFAMLGIAMRVGDTDAPRVSARANRVMKVAGVAVAIVVAVSFLMPWIAAREVDSALHGWRADPQVAFERLDRARRLDPLSDRADVYASVIAGEIGDEARQRAALQRALERNPHNWYPYMQLGVLEMRAGRRASALRYLAQARRLNRLETALIVVEDWIRDGHAPTRKDVDEVLVARAAHLEGGAR